jgi:hypothetical protein
VKPKPHSLIDDDPTPPGPYDPEGADDLWFLPPEEPDDDPVVRIVRGLVDAAAWKAAEGALAGDLAELAFDAGRLAERVTVAGPGAVQRLALAEAASLSWWSGDRVAADRLALWLSYRIGAVEEGGAGLIRTAWAARRLAAPVSAGAQGRDVTGVLTQALGEGRADAGLVADVAAELDPLAGASGITRGCALCHLWRSLDERPDHLRGLEAAVLGARVAVFQNGAGQGQAMPFLPLTLTGFTALTAGGSPEARLAGWISGAHRAVLSALMLLDRLAAWRARAEAATADLQGRTPARLISALAAHPMLAAPQAAAETGASRAAVQRNLDLLVARGLAREVTGQGRFRVWAAGV